jgi:predicted DNA-binding transcriptional regulator YafY
MMVTDSGTNSRMVDRMSRATRMLELLIRLEAKSRFAVDELAGEFGVSRRTMLRDLQALSEMGVPLASRSGPGGGYSLIRDRRLLPLSLTVDEALGMLISYEGFLRYAQSPFSAQNLSAVTRLRAALPAETVQELDRLRRHVAIISRPPRSGAPFLPDLLQAALDGVHLRIDYDGRSGRSTRVIFPFGLFASDGYWYCACHDGTRDRNLSLRVDRMLTIERVEGLERPQHVPLDSWFDIIEHDDGSGLPLRIRVTGPGMKNFNLSALFQEIRETDDGGVIEETIPRSEVGWFATQLLAVGADAVVESPAELIEAIRAQAQAIVRQYEPSHN